MNSDGNPESKCYLCYVGIDRKEVDKAFAQLKKDGAFVSPFRCKWQPAE